ncbi:hypothetical protein OPW36_20715 [Vibrio europaeus]|uniref:hypothetical protein n=1 Tax=Vibrio europaeus TaxID=300876 RepID=UPI00233EF4A4|nr:hypothetical protein [Vibrio europaeus]MDC5804768.1 hypothetical protein [Vibrio europaeus]MDC5827157.1 hypothetical protein [Vibrio europaeus]MDC5832523.1 hypothetical protein [Vibrio europaeus]MDC5835478.1 hypothetical protein [Vibrio europaeus]
MALSKDHLYVLLCAFVIFCGGVLLGLISSIDKSQFDLFFTALSSISTLGLLIAGVYSYVSWKKHMNYGYLYESAKSMYLVMSQCTPLYTSLYLKFQSINRSETDLDEWLTFFRSEERQKDIENLSSLVHKLNAEMQTLEIISDSKDYQNCFTSVSTYTQFVVTLIKELKNENSSLKPLKAEEQDNTYKLNLGNMAFMQFKECESEVKSMLTSFINNH